MTTNTTLNLGNVQETMEDTIKNARRIGRKSMMAYLGLVGMAYDFATKDGVKLIAKAEKRGEVIEKEMTQRVNKLQKQTMHEVESLRSNVEQRVDSVKGDVNEVVEKLQKGFKTILSAPDAKEAMQEIEIAAVTIAESATAEVEKVAKATKSAIKKSAVKKSVTKSVQQVEKATEAVIAAIEKLDLPIEEYDKLTWNQVVGKIETMDSESLIKVREYELANRKRPSILKAIDAKLEAVAA